MVGSFRGLLGSLHGAQIVNANVNVMVYSLSISIYILSLNFTFTPWPGFQNFFTQVICLSSLREHTTVLPQYSTHTKNPLAARYPLLLGGERHRQGDIQPGPKHCHLWESNPHRGDSL